MALPEPRPETTNPEVRQAASAQEEKKPLETSRSTAGQAFVDLAEKWLPGPNPIPPKEVQVTPTSEKITLPGTLPRYQQTPQMEQMMGQWLYGPGWKPQTQDTTGAVGGWTVPPPSGGGIPADYEGGTVGPFGEPLPPGALQFDAQGQPYYGEGFAGWARRVRARAFGDPDYSESNLFQILSDFASPYAEKREGISSFWGGGGPVGRAHEKFGVEQTVLSAYKKPEILLAAYGDVFSYIGDVFHNLKQTQFLLGLPAIASRAVDVAIQDIAFPAFDAIDRTLERAIGTVAYTATGTPLEQAFEEGRFFYSALFNEQTRTEIQRELQEGKDPQLIRAQYGNPVNMLIGDVATGIITGRVWKLLKSLGTVTNISKYTEMADETKDAFRTFQAARNADEVEAGLELASAAVKADVLAYTKKVETLRDGRGLFKMQARGKRGFFNEYTTNFVMRIIAESTDEVTGLPDYRRVIDLLHSVARPFSGDPEDIKAAIQTWNTFNAPTTLWGEQGKMAGKVLYETIFGPDAAKDINWLVKQIEGAGGDTEKLVDTLQKVFEKNVEAMFPSLTDLVEEEATALKQARAAGLHAGLSDAETIKAMTGRDPLSWGAKRLALINDGIAGGIYSPINKVLSTLYMGMSPGYAVRNWMSNNFHLFVDFGPRRYFGMLNPLHAERVTGQYLGYVPYAATRAFGGAVAGAVMPNQWLLQGKGWLGEWANTFSRLSAKLEQNAAKRVVAMAVEENMQRMMGTLLKDKEIAAVLGENLNGRFGRMLVTRLMEEKGNVGKVADWFRDAVREGHIEGWRSLFIMDDDQLELLKVLRKVDGESDLLTALRTHTSPDDFAQQMGQLKEKLRRIANLSANDFTKYSVEDLKDFEPTMELMRAVEEGAVKEVSAVLFEARLSADRFASEKWYEVFDNLTEGINVRLQDALGKIPGLDVKTKQQLQQSIWSLTKGDIEQMGKKVAAITDERRNLVRQISDALSTADPKDFHSMLARAGFAPSLPRALSRQQAKNLLWQNFFTWRNATWETHRAAQGTRVLGELANAPAHIKDLIKNPLFRDLDPELLKNFKGLDVLADEVQVLIDGSPLIRSAEQAAETAQRWGLVTEQMFVAMGAAYAQWPGAMKVLDVFAKLGIPTAANDGIPFDLRGLAGIAKNGAKHIGVSDDVINELFTADKFRSAVTWSDSELDVLKNSLIGWLKSRFPDFDEIFDVSREGLRVVGPEDVVRKFMQLDDYGDLDLRAIVGGVDATTGRAFDWIRGRANPGEWIKNLSTVTNGVHDFTTEEFVNFMRRSPLDEARIDAFIKKYNIDVAGKYVGKNVNTGQFGPGSQEFWKAVDEFFGGGEKDKFMTFWLDDLAARGDAANGIIGSSLWEATKVRGAFARMPDGTTRWLWGTDSSHAGLLGKAGITDNNSFLASFERRWDGMLSGSANVGGGITLMSPRDEDLKDMIEQLLRAGVSPTDQTIHITQAGQNIGRFGDVVQSHFPDLIQAKTFATTRRGLQFNMVFDDAMKVASHAIENDKARGSVGTALEVLLESTRVKDKAGYAKELLGQDLTNRQWNYAFEKLVALSDEGSITKAQIEDIFKEAKALPDNLEELKVRLETVLNLAGAPREDITDALKVLEHELQDDLVREKLVKILEGFSETPTGVSAAVTQQSREWRQVLNKLRGLADGEQHAWRGAFIRKTPNGWEISYQGTAIGKDEAEIRETLDFFNDLPGQVRVTSDLHDAEILKDAGWQQVGFPAKVPKAENAQDVLDYMGTVQSGGVWEPSSATRAGRAAQVEREGAGVSKLADSFKPTLTEVVGETMQAEQAAEAAASVRPGTRTLSRDEMWDWMREELGFDPKMDPIRPTLNSGVPPSYAQAVDGNLDGLNQYIDDIVERVRSNFGKVDLANDLGVEDLEKVNQWEKLANDRLGVFRAEAAQLGTEARKFTLLDYENRKGFDAMLGYVYPYQFWYTRTYANWLKRIADDPQLIMHYARYRRYLEQRHAGMPDWWKYNINSCEALGISCDHPFFFNLEQSLNPLYGLTGEDFNDPARQRDSLNSFADSLGKFGPTVWTPIMLALAVRAKYILQDDDAAASMAGRIIPQTRLIHAIAGQFKDLPDFLKDPDPGVQIFSDGVDYWERKRIGRMLWEMAQTGEITLEQAVEASYAQTGDIWNRAWAAAVKRRAPGDLSGFALGAGFKSRSESDISIDNFFSARNSLLAMGPNMSPEEYAAAWDQLREAYPFMDTVLISRQAGPERDRPLAYNVLGRIPPGDTGQFLEWAQIPQSLVDKFYDNKGNIETWAETDRMRFMAGILDLQAVLTMPRGVQQQEWSLVRHENRLMWARIRETWGEDISDRIDVYYAERNKDPKLGYAYLERYPEVEAALDYRTQHILNNPLMDQYYGGIDTLERYLKSLMYDDAERLFGEDIWDLQQAFWDISDAGGNTKQFLRDTSTEYGKHSRLKDYWAWKDGQEDLISQRMTEFGEKLNPLAEAVLRSDVREDTLGTLSVLTGLFEAQAEQADPREVALNGFVRKYLEGTQGDTTETKVPALPTSAYYTQVPYDYIARFIPSTLQAKLDRWWERGEPLSTENRTSLNDIWKKLGQPGGNFNDWLTKILRAQWEGRGGAETNVPLPLTGGGRPAEVDQLIQNFQLPVR